jgi:hypothetical protein
VNGNTNRRTSSDSEGDQETGSRTARHAQAAAVLFWSVRSVNVFLFILVVVAIIGVGRFNRWLLWVAGVERIVDRHSVSFANAQLRVQLYTHALLLETLSYRCKSTFDG